jgi:hypothetical protein
MALSQLNGKVMQMQEENGTVQDDEGPAPAPQPEAPAKKPRKPRGPNKPKVKPADKPIEFDDPPAEPDPRIDAVARAELEAAKSQLEAARDEAAQNVQVRKPGTWGEIEEQILASRRKLAEEQARPHVPAQRTERQQQTLDAEIAAGRRRLAHFEAQEKARQQIPPDPNDPKPTPVFRPKEFVPDINSKDPSLSSQDLK